MKTVILVALCVFTALSPLVIVAVPVAVIVISIMHAWHKKAKPEWYYADAPLTKYNLRPTPFLSAAIEKWLKENNLGGKK